MSSGQNPQPARNLSTAKSLCLCSVVGGWATEYRGTQRFHPLLLSISSFPQQSVPRSTWPITSRRMAFPSGSLCFLHLLPSSKLNAVCPNQITVALSLHAGFCPRLLPSRAHPTPAEILRFWLLFHSTLFFQDPVHPIARSYWFLPHNSSQYCLFSLLGPPLCSDLNLSPGWLQSFPLSSLWVIHVTHWHKTDFPEDLLWFCKSLDTRFYLTTLEWNSEFQYSPPLS